MNPRVPRGLILTWIALAVLFAISLTYRVRETADRYDELRRGTTLARLPFDVDLPEFTISELRPESERAGIRRDDTVVAAQGRPVRRPADLFGQVRDAKARDRFTVSVAPADGAASGIRTVPIELQPLRENAATGYDWLYFLIADVAKPYLCLGLGFWVAAVRIRRAQAWLLLLLLLGVAEFAAGNWRTFLARSDPFQPVGMVYQFLVAYLGPVSLFLFGISFPDPLPFERRRPWLKWIPIVPMVIWIAVSTLTIVLLWAGRGAAAIWLERSFSWLSTPVGILQLLAIVTFFVVMGYRTLTASNSDDRRRLLLLDTGAVASFAPLLVFILLSVTGLADVTQAAVLPIFAVMFLFPLTMAYVIVVERAMDVRVVVRQGLRYLLARGTLRIVQVALSVVIVAAAATMGAAGSPATRILLIAAGLAAVVLIQTSADRIRLWVDRRFFREAYDAERILSDLANNVRSIVQTGPLLETVARQLSNTLHVPRVAIFLNGQGQLTPAYALGEWSGASVAFPHDSLTDDAQRALQTTLESELLLPLAFNRKLVGVLGLGPKQSEEPFSGADIRLLGAVATQTGLALENSRLTAEIADEVARREKARRELEIAHEVQERLFPQTYPPIPGLEYAGACRPALGVGGDYYDFIRISDVELGIAVGDVSGKGIPAALLMATLRAYLRGQTIGGESDLAAMMANLNALVFESSASNRYATFFYGQYDARTRTLHYVNGGHNPPIVVRRSGDAVVQLDVGGPVIGLMEDCRYTEGSVTLESGDVLVAFTDGITEAMNARDEEWGDEQLVAALGPNRGLPARQIIDRLMHAADAFVAGAPQHDDMTLVVVRLL